MVLSPFITVGRLVVVERWIGSPSVGVREWVGWPQWRWCSSSTFFSLLWWPQVGASTCCEDDSLLLLFITVMNVTHHWQYCMLHLKPVGCECVDSGCHSPYLERNASLSSWSQEEWYKRSSISSSNQTDQSIVRVILIGNQCLDNGDGDNVPAAIHHLWQPEVRAASETWSHSSTTDLLWTPTSLLLSVFVHLDHDLWAQVTPVSHSGGGQSGRGPTRGYWEVSYCFCCCFDFLLGHHLISSSLAS